MEILNKIENLVNTLILKMCRVLWHLFPKSFRYLSYKFIRYYYTGIKLLKKSPALILHYLLDTFKVIKADIASIDFKARFKANYEAAMARFKAEEGAKSSKVKMIIFAPYYLVCEWVKGLTFLQSSMLLGFTVASMFAVVGIYSSTQSMLHQLQGPVRKPASVEVHYERPAYYKEEVRQLELSTLVIPIYASNLKEMKQVDIDVIATTTTRESKNFLIANNVKLRDHLVLNVEPFITRFPLVEEGKVILKQKLRLEMTEFLKTHHVPGEVRDVEITYFLAN